MRINALGLNNLTHEFQNRRCTVPGGAFCACMTRIQVVNEEQVVVLVSVDGR